MAADKVLIHVEGHCHIGCQKMELWIVDDPANPKLLCRTKVNYGTGDEAHNEMGYILGNEPSLKFQNNTVSRYGDMGLWEIRGALLKTVDE
eukprot:gene31989-16826_t